MSWVRAALLILALAASQAQNITESARYPAYKADLDRFQAAFDAGGDRGESIADEGIRAARQSGDRAGEAHWLRMLGASFQRRGDLRKAREHYEASLAIRRELGQKTDMLLLNVGIGNVCYMLRDLPASLRFASEAISLSSALGQFLDEGRAWQLKAMSERLLQKSDDAAVSLANAIDRFGKAGPAGQAGLALARIELTRLDAERAEFPAALREGFEGLRILRALPRREADVASALDAIGLVFHYLEDPRKALDYYQQALEIRSKIPNANLTENYRNLGVELDKLGDHRQAIEYFQKVVTAQRKGGQPADLAGGLINLAIAQQNSNQVAAARANLHEALGLLPDTPAFRRQRATCLYGLGNLDLAEDRNEDALRRHQEALRLREASGDSLGELRSMNRIAIALEAAMRWKDALEWHERAESQFERLLAKIDDPVQLVAFRATSRILYPHQARVLVELNRPEEALVVAERGRGTGLQRAESLQGLSGPAKKSVDEFMARAAGDRNRLRLALESGDESAKRAAEIRYLESDRELQRARDALFAGTSTVAGAGRGSGLRFDSLLAMARLHPDTLFLEWVEVDERVTLLFALSEPDGLRVHRLPSSLPDVAATLDQWITTLRTGRQARGVTIPVDGRDNGIGETDLAKSLYAAVFGPASRAIESGRYKRLVAIGEGPLSRTPFPALADASGKRLVERLSVSTAVSLTALLRPPGTARKKTSLLAIGDPIGTGTVTIAPKGVRFSPLTGAREEALDIAKPFADRMVMTGREARESAVKTRMPKYDIVHFATHGILDGEDALRSALLLAPEPADSAEDGLLEAWEIAGMKLSTRLAVLSACETGQGSESVSDGILGLSWAFQAAGCPDVVASLWSVDDTATRALMQAFYRRIQAGDRLDDALRSAMLELRGNRSYQSPYYWAAFQIIGPGRRLITK